MDSKLPKYKILTLDAREIYDLKLINKGFNIYGEDGQINYKRFNSFLHNSLEMKHLRQSFENAKSRRKIGGKFEIGAHLVGDERYPATVAVINVVFNCDEKEYNKKKSLNGYVYVLRGEEVDFKTELTDHLCIRNGKLVAIEVPYNTKKNGLLVSDSVYLPVKSPCKKELLGKYFEYDSENLCYVTTDKQIPTYKDREFLREDLYKNGFSLAHDERYKYVRYKRSAGSSRQGNCLFILEPLYKEMMKWSSCGLDLDKVTDIISKESYISLTLSNMEKEILIPKESILFIPDAVSTFTDRVIAVEKNEKSGVFAEEKDVEVSNSIWDGQGLLDTSVFVENGYEDKGMMLLRNRFFKTCAFNTNLQKWFKDNGITSKEQLNKFAYTRAETIDQIKLVITDSSLKYIKISGKGRIAAIDQWLNSLDDSVFGLVKTEKPTKHMFGRMVKTSYQLINTLNLSKEEIDSLLKDSLDYLTRIQNDPMYMRYYIDMSLSEDEFDESGLFENRDEKNEDDSEVVSNMRRNVVLRLLQLNDEFANTEEYANFRTQIKKSYVRDLRKGHLVVRGTNATLFGNGYDMLCAIIDKDYDFDNPIPLSLSGNEIRISRFENGEELLCARSPHITMGNLFIAKNVYYEDDVYSKYFHLSDEIVCVNSCGENLLQRLNGCDFDSDMMLITDNRIMLNSAKKNYDKFLVPYCKVDSEPREGINLWTIDKDISNNKIGQIVNLSQFLNSVFWDKVSKGAYDMELYKEICKLAVLSGIEIDKAKRDYGIKAQTVLDKARKKLEKGQKKPEFFKHTKKNKGVGTIRKSVQVQDDDKETVLFDSLYTEDIFTSMQLLNNAVAKGTRKSKRGLNSKLSSLLPPVEKFEPSGNDYKYRKEIIDMISEKQMELSNLRGLMFRLSDDEKSAKMQECRAIELECVNFVKKKMKNDNIMRLLISAIDDNYKYANSCRSLILSCICNANDNFYRAVASTRKDMYKLVLDENGDLDIMGYKHSAVLSKEGNI